MYTFNMKFLTTKLNILSECENLYNYHPYFFSIKTNQLYVRINNYHLLIFFTNFLLLMKKNKYIYLAIPYSNNLFKVLIYKYLYLLTF